MIWSIDYDSPTSITNPGSGTTEGDGDGGDDKTYSCDSCSQDPHPNVWPKYDPEDLGGIKKLAAIGDSYSAGIGAGDRLGSKYDALTGGTGKHISLLHQQDLHSPAGNRLGMQPLQQRLSEHR